MFRCATLCCALPLALATLAAPAAADDAARLDYRAASGCPGEPEFVAAVRSRGGQLERPPPELAGARISVVLERQGEDFVGSVALRKSLAEPSTREVRARECAEAMQGLALITAVSLRAGAAPPPAAAEPLPPAESAPPAPPHLQRIGQFGVDSVSVGPGSLVFDHHVTLSLAAGAELGAIPGVLVPRYDLTFTRANFVTTPDGAHYLGGGWLPRLRFALLGPGEYHSDDGYEAQVASIQTTFGGCTAIAYDLEGLIVLGCGEVGFGLANVETRDAAGVRTQSEAMGVGLIGLELDTRYSLGPIDIGLKLGGAASMGRVSAERPDGSDLFQSAPFNAHLLLGVGMRF